MKRFTLIFYLLLVGCTETKIPTLNRYHRPKVADYPLTQPLDSKDVMGLVDALNEKGNLNGIRSFLHRLGPQGVDQMAEFYNDFVDSPSSSKNFSSWILSQVESKNFSQWQNRLQEHSLQPEFQRAVHFLERALKGEHFYSLMALGIKLRNPSLSPLDPPESPDFKNKSTFTNFWVHSLATLFRSTSHQQEWIQLGDSLCQGFFLEQILNSLQVLKEKNGKELANGFGYGIDRLLQEPVEIEEDTPSKLDQVNQLIAATDQDSRGLFKALEAVLQQNPEWVEKLSKKFNVDLKPIVWPTETSPFTLRDLDTDNMLAGLHRFLMAVTESTWSRLYRLIFEQIGIGQLSLYDQNVLLTLLEEPQQKRILKELLGSLQGVTELAKPAQSENSSILDFYRIILRQEPSLTLSFPRILSFVSELLSTPLKSPVAHLQAPEFGELIAPWLFQIGQLNADEVRKVGSDLHGAFCSSPSQVTDWTQGLYEIYKNPLENISAFAKFYPHFIPGWAFGSGSSYEFWQTWLESGSLKKLVSLTKTLEINELELLVDNLIALEKTGEWHHLLQSLLWLDSKPMNEFALALIQWQESGEWKSTLNSIALLLDLLKKS